MRVVAFTVLVATSIAGAFALSSTASGGPETAAAKTTRFTVRWNERWPLEGGGYVEFRVRLIEAGQDGWRVRGGFTNRSRHRLRITRRLSEYGNPPKNVGPALLRWVVKDVALPGLSARPVLFFADRISPALPATVAPGESWNGTIAGSKRLPRRVPLFVRLGHFFYAGPVETEGFSWISEHRFELR